MFALFCFWLDPPESHRDHVEKGEYHHDDGHDKNHCCQRVLTDGSSHKKPIGNLIQRPKHHGHRGRDGTAEEEFYGGNLTKIVASIGFLQKIGWVCCKIGPSKKGRLSNLKRVVQSAFLLYGKTICCILRIICGRGARTKKPIWMNRCSVSVHNE